MAQNTYRFTKNLKPGNFIVDRGGRTRIVEGVEFDEQDPTKVYLTVTGVPEPYHLDAEKLVKVTNVREAR